MHVVSDITSLRRTAEFRCFFHGKFVELLAINHSLSEMRGIFVPRLLKLLIFLSRFSITTIHESQDCRGSGRAFLVKGCVRYIFASLVFKSKRDFYFTSKALFVLENVKF